MDFAHRILEERKKYHQTRVHAEPKIDLCGFTSASLVQASFLWFDLKPDEILFHSSPPKKIISIAKIIFEKVPPDSFIDLAEERDQTWRDIYYNLDDLRKLANQRNEKPPFLFPEYYGDFDNWLRLNDFHPDDTQELTQGGYKAISIMIDLISKQNNCSHTQAIQLIVGEAEHQKNENPDLNIRGIGKSTLEKFAKNGTAYLKK